MSIRDVGSYIGHNRVTTTSQDSASGIWSLAAVERRMRAAAWPVLVAQDPDFARVSLLLHMDGTGNTFVDSSASPKTLTAAGNVTQSTAQSKWGGKSAYVDGNGDYISVANTSGLDFGTGDFAVEFWIFFTNSVSTSQQILYSEANGGWFIGLFNAGEIGIGRSSVAWDHYTSHSMTTNTWNHIAVARAGTSLRIFVNGSQVGTTYTNSQSYTLAGGALRIGGTGPEYNVTGYIDDVRITKGTARGYTGATITVPTAAFPDAGPFPVAGLQLWLDASDASTLYDATSGGSLVAANGGVARWEDKSGNGRHATQSTSADRPQRKTAIQSGKDVLRFDGSNDVLVCASASDWRFLHESSATIFLAFRGGNVTDPNTFYYALATSGTVIEPGGISIRHDTRDGYGSGQVVFVAGRAGARTVSGSANLAGNVFGLVSIVSSQAQETPSQRASTRINGGSAVADNTSTAEVSLGDPRHAIAIGAGKNSSDVFSGFLVGDIAEIIIYNSALSDTNRQAVENYLLAKWGIA